MLTVLDFNGIIESVLSHSSIMPPYARAWRKLISVTPGSRGATVASNASMTLHTDGHTSPVTA